MPQDQPKLPAAQAKFTTPRVRLLPVLAGVMALVLTIRVGDMYHKVSVGIGTETQAQTTPAANAAPTQPAANTAPTQPAANATPTQPAAAGNATATAPAGNGTATEPAAPAEGASTEGAPAEGAPAAKKDPLEYTDEEVEVLQQLAKRREDLELKSRQLDEREAMVAAAEQRMEQKMAELKALQSTVEDLLKKRSDAEEQRLQALVQTYEKMKPKDAAQVFEELDMDLLVDLVSRMKPGKSAPILAMVTPTKVKELTFELAQQKALPLTP
ncbi:MotE family protein [Dongia sp.]|uniref:MotE family protein n=1 Tax=Dongia sp. TaxID=1977262 RepID=UPI0035AEAAF1